jgi:hypothetical protein
LAASSQFKPIPGDWEFSKRSAIPKGSSGKALAKKNGVQAVATRQDFDTAWFTPAYTESSPHFGVRPPPGSFIHGDAIRARISNAITDLAGNALDLTGVAIPSLPGSRDTVFSLAVDTTRLRVVSIRPDPESGNWAPDSALRIRFNAPLHIRTRPEDPLGLDDRPLPDDGNSSISITSELEGGRPLGLRDLTLEEGGRTLVLWTRRRAVAYDTLHLRLAASLIDTSWLPLDGDGDGIPLAYYDPTDTTDAYRFVMTVGASDFYLFPNPFRFSNARHREKGQISFKNLHRLKGFKSQSPVSLRIYTLMGDEVASVRSNATPGPQGIVGLDWDLRNRIGVYVATGVYVYALFQSGDQPLKKGKLAIVR